jgi:hypothetical protein
MLTLCAAPFFAGLAGAEGVQAVITTEITDNIGTNSGSFALSLNGAPLAIVDEQMVMLNEGDVLRAEVSSFAELIGSGTTSVGGYQIGVDLFLPAETLSATVQNVFSGNGDSEPESAYGGVGNNITCDFTFTGGGCSAPGLPGSIAFSSGVQSSTFSAFNNEIIINNVATPTGRVGGPESLDPLTTVLELTPLDGSSSASTDIRSVSQVLFDATSSGSGVLEITVTDLTVVPVPATAWLFGSALCLFGWLQRRGS